MRHEMWLLPSLLALSSAFPQSHFYRPMSPRGRLGAASFQSLQSSLFPSSSIQLHNFHGQHRQLPTHNGGVFGGYGPAAGGGYLIPGVAPSPPNPGMPFVPTGQSLPYNQLGGMGGFPSAPAPASGRGCPMSPFATFLTNEQQEALHELITEARSTGADEGTVREFIDKYLKQVLSPDRLAQFNAANEAFEKQRRGKREARDEKEEPELVSSRLSDFFASPGLADELRQPRGEPNARLL